MRFYQRPFHRNYWLVRESYLAFSHGIDISSELHVREILAKLGVILAGQELLEEARLCVSQILHALDDFFGAAHHCPVVVFRSNAVEHIENGDFILFACLVE